MTLQDNNILKSMVFEKLHRRNFLVRKFDKCRLGSIGLYYTMDYDLWLRMSKAAEPLILPENLGCFRWYANSKSGKINRRQFDEQYEVASPHLAGDPVSRMIHRLNVEKIVLAYRLMRFLGR